MILLVKRNKTVADLQSEFNEVYPFLKLNFYKKDMTRPGNEIRQKIPKSFLLSACGNIQEGELDIDDAMTVGQLEKAFYDKFRINVQVARKSGGVWLETTITDNWTLKQQNDHGRELSSQPATDTPGIQE